MTDTRIADVLKQRVQAALQESDSAVVPANTLTEFPWQKLCFQRGEALRLTFHRDGVETVVELDYNEFFVDEGYVEGSLDGACLASGDRVVVRRKYPRDTGPFEFMKAPAAVTP